MHLKGEHLYKCKPTCPHCGIMFDAGHSGHEGEVPKVGDFAICVYCGEFAVFGTNMQLRLLTPDETIILKQLQGGFFKAIGEEQAAEYRQNVADVKTMQKRQAKKKR